MDILDLTIEDVLPSIFNNQCFIVYPQESVYTAAVCLIPAIEVYIDGVIVINDNNKPIGRIGSKNILKAYKEHGVGIFNHVIREIMYATNDSLKIDSTIRDAVNDMINNRFGFVPIVNNEGILSVVSIYDILKIILKMPLDLSIDKLGSKIITIDSNTSINDAIDIMLKSNIRRLFINDNIPYLVTGRVILNFIIENSIGAIDVSNVSIDRLRIKGVVMDKDIDIKSVIVALLNQTPPSSVVINDRVITPMDIIKNVIRYK